MSKVLLLTEFFPPEHGGVQRSLEVAMRTLGSDLSVITPPQDGDAAYDQTQAYRIERRSLFSGRGWPSWWWLIKKIHSHKPDLVVFGHFSSATLAAKIARVPYAILVHGRDLLVEKNRWPGKWFIGSVLQHAEWVGVNSNFTGELVHAYGVPRSLIVRTHPTVDDEAVTNRAQSNAQRLITICRLVRRKNVARVIEAVATLPEVQYDIVGDGPEHRRLEELIATHELQDRVHLHGSLEEPQKWELLNQATAAVMIPEVREQGSDVEGLGIFYLEAAALGLPLVASATGGVTDIVQDGKTGATVDPADSAAIAEGIKTALTQAQAFGSAAQALVKHEFTTSVRNRRLEALVDRESMANPPLVSVILPAYQSAKTIPDTLRALEKQTWPRVQIIVVNDGSTDDLSAAIEPWRDRITLIEQSNLGAPAARNAGAAAAEGDFLLFCDADMWLAPTMITDMVVALMTHPDASYTYSNFRFGPKDFNLFEFSDDALRQQNYIHTSSLIRRRDFIQFDPALKKFQDWDLWLTMLTEGKRGIWIPKQLFRVQQRAGGMSTWLPSLAYKLPGIGQGKGSHTIRKYREAEAVIRTKHGLN